MDGKTPIFGGRWQPFHNGHLYVLNRILEVHDVAIIGIVNPDPDNPPDKDFDRFHTDSNPLYFWERALMITRLLREKGWSSRVRIVPMWHPRASLEKDENYLPPRRRRFWYVPIIAESEEKKVADLRRLGEEVVTINNIPLDMLKFRSAVVRNTMRSRESWDELVPKEISAFLKDLNLSQKRWRSSNDRRFPIFAGRWQPLHRGHLAIIKRIIDEYGEIVIGVINPEPKQAEWQDYPSFHPVHNPFTFWERLEMLTATLAEEGFIDKSYIVPLWHPRKSLIREEAYLPPNRVWIVPKTSTHELEKISELNERGEEVIGIDVAEEFQGVSSTDIKSKMCSGDDWSQCVPTSAADYIRTHHGIEKITSLIESNKDAFNEYRKAKSQNR